MQTMRIAVAGATGNIGAHTAAALERAGHDVVRISRSPGVDLSTGEGLDAALVGVEALVDTTSPETADPDEAVAYFGTTTQPARRRGAGRRPSPRAAPRARAPASHRPLSTNGSRSNTEARAATVKKERAALPSAGTCAPARPRSSGDGRITVPPRCSRGIRGAVRRA
ncbi:hypothetical protein SY2F82_33580 [Streptomyces sp. Y2F8-2]|nr:hypothetical protein SY2F82_33580 [Streptomyces sp. Y2F8-2]